MKCLTGQPFHSYMKTMDFNILEMISVSASVHHIKDGPRLKPRTPCVFIFVCESKLKCCGLVSPLGLSDVGLHFSCCCDKAYGCLLLLLRFCSFLSVVSETESTHSVGTFRNKTNNLSHSVS